MQTTKSQATINFWHRTRRWLLASVAMGLMSLAACGGSGDDVDRGPTTIAVTAELNGVFWDSGASRLYVTDEASNSVRYWDGDKSFPTWAALPAAPTSGNTLGQLTRTSNGTMYLTRFGFGTDGTVITVPPSGTGAVNLTGLDPSRRRIGVTTTPDGSLLDGWFVRGGTGSVSELVVQGGGATEKELVTGLGKPVGLAVLVDQLFISDQNTGKVLAFSLSAVRAKPATASEGRVVATFTTLDGLDLMTVAPDGTLFFGGSGGKLFKVSATGTVTTLAQGWPKIRGVAYDAANKRLFVGVVAPDAASQASVRIVPVD